MIHAERTRRRPGLLLGARHSLLPPASAPTPHRDGVLLAHEARGEIILLAGISQTRHDRMRDRYSTATQETGQKRREADDTGDGDTSPIVAGFPRSPSLCWLCVVCVFPQRSRALQGDYRAARALLLPVYEPMIMLLTVSLSIEYLFLYLQHSEEKSVMFITVVCQWSLNIFTQIGLVLFFCSHSLSHPALLRSLFYAFLLSVVGFICALIDRLWDPLLGQILFNALPLPLLVAIVAKKIYRRRSVVPYVQFMILYRIVWVIYTIFTECIDSHTGYFICLLAIALLEIPLSVFWFLTMWNDTYFWRTGGLHMEGASNGVWKAVRRVVFGRGSSKAVRIRAVQVNSVGGSMRPHSPNGEGADDAGFSPLMYEHSALHGTEHELSSVQTSNDGASGYSLSIDTTTWGLGYEVEALRRIKILQNQDRQFEEAQRARARKRGLALMAGGGNAAGDGNSSSLSAAGSMQPRSHSPISGLSMSDAFHLSNGSTGPNGLNPALSSSPSGHTLPRAERLLAHSSDLLLSHDVQVLIEANKRRFIDFGLLHINDADCIGRGGSSRVYSGFYRNYPVAIKFFAAESNSAEGRNDELTSETVKAYAKETAIAAAITHPNVVMFIGICVRPPVIFLVSELCSEGSLFSVLPRIKFHPSWGYHAILSFCVQCARSLVYLHENGFVHRDIKSLNYMVTHRGELKLTDFGLSRMFPQWEKEGKARTRTPPPTATHAACGSSSNSAGTYTPPRSSHATAGSSAASVSTASSASAVPATPSSRSAAIAPHLMSSAHHGLVPAPRPLVGLSAAHAHAQPVLSLHPQELLTRRVGSRCWMSPEMIHGRAYSFSSDIYSLAMVCWEILTAQAPFDEVPDEDLTAVVMAGHTPAIPSWTPPAFAALLREGWARQPDARPTARDMLERLEFLQSELESEFKLERFDASVFFRPEAPELIYQHQLQLFEQQQRAMNQQPISHVRVAPSAEEFAHSQQNSVR